MQVTGTHNHLRSVVLQIRRSEANLSLFLGLLVFTAFVLPSTGFEQNDERLYGDVAGCLIFIYGATIARHQRYVLYMDLGIVAAALVLKGAVWFYPDNAFGVWPDVLSLLAFAMIFFILLSQIFALGRVTPARIQGAVAAYLSLGFMWAHAFAITARINPASFKSSGAPAYSIFDWVYYSFATLTTLGYGDIVPVSQTSRALSVAEALTGQLYLAVMLAQLVSLRVSGSGQKEIQTEK